MEVNIVRTPQAFHANRFYQVRPFRRDYRGRLWQTVFYKMAFITVYATSLCLKYNGTFPGQQRQLTISTNSSVFLPDPLPSVVDKCDESVTALSLITPVSGGRYQEYLQCPE